MSTRIHEIVPAEKLVEMTKTQGREIIPEEKLVDLRVKPMPTKALRNFYAKLRLARLERPFGPFREHRNLAGETNDTTDGLPGYISPTRVIQYTNGRKHGMDVDIWGTENYFWKGVMVPRRFFTHKDELTIDEIMKNPNAEVRRVGIEIYGFDRAIDEGHFKLVHSDERTGARMYTIEMGNLTVQIVRVLDGTELPDGTRKVYFLQVPPDKKTCREAIAWTFRKEENEYNPAIET